jgi:hypothetical protein
MTYLEGLRRLWRLYQPAATARPDPDASRVIHVAVEGEAPRLREEIDEQTNDNLSGFCPADPGS